MPHAPGLGAPCAHDLGVGARFGLMRLDVPVGGRDGLPDPIQVGVAVFRPRDTRPLVLALAPRTPQYRHGHERRNRDQRFPSDAHKSLCLSAPDSAVELRADSQQPCTEQLSGVQPCRSMVDVMLSTLLALKMLYTSRRPRTPAMR